VDYWRVLDDGTGAMKAGLAIDGVHPNEAGYDAMATVLEPILRRMFGRPAAA
jgi:lysophospholipase L1-like esterase